MIKPLHARPAAPVLWLAAATTAFAGLAVFNQLQRRAAEKSHPAAGTFIHKGGARVHLIERGTGEPLLLLHGNGAGIEDLEASGLTSAAAERYKVIAVDRPGFGYSSRPRRKLWNASAQADLLHEALGRMGVSRCLVLGHSWGAAVAVQMALRHPEAVRGLVLVSGYYFPTTRVDAVLSSAPALPVIGDLWRHTLLPLIGRAMWPLLARKMFRPAAVPPRFSRAMKELALRPGQLRATAAESGLLIPDAALACSSYDDFQCPVGIVAGAGDQVISPEAQSAKLHDRIPGSLLDLVPGAGHMVHYFAPERLVAMVDRIAARASSST